MGNCIICKKEVPTKDKSLLFVEVCCPECGTYTYERTFRTTLDFFISSQNMENQKRILKHMKDIVATAPTCFVDDFESVEMDTHQLYELIDIINPLGIDFAHNNVVDSEYKD